jgi:hypothetical protein
MEHRTDATRPDLGFSTSAYLPGQMPGQMDDALEKMVRYAAIDLNKLWVQVRSLPAFMTTLTDASVHEIQRTLEWLRQTPAWHARIRNPRVAHALAQPESRRRVLDFARDVLCVRAIRRRMAEFQATTPEDRAGLGRQRQALANGAAWAQAEALEGVSVAELVDRLDGARREHERLARLIGEFGRLSEDSGAPLPSCSGEATRLLEALEGLAEVPAAVLAWRVPALLDPAQRARIQEWRDRAAPILELREKLEAEFRLDEPMGPETLRKIAEAIDGGGLFRAFKSRYKDAMDAYQALRLPPGQGRKKLPRQKRVEILERLEAWARYLEMDENYDERFEGRLFFGEGFRGADTDFAGALAANAWATEARARFLREDETGPDAFGRSLMLFLLQAHPAKLAQARQGAQALVTQGARERIAELKLALRAPWAAEEQARARRAQAFTALGQIARGAALHESLALARLSELAGLSDEAEFLLAGMDANTELQALLKPDYAGPATDLAPIDQARAYVKFVMEAPIRDELKLVFLSPTGVLRFADARTFALQGLPALGTVHAHFRRLEEALGSPVSEARFAETPVEALAGRFQEALRLHRRGPLLA